VVRVVVVVVVMVVVQLLPPYSVWRPPSSHTI
jgi:hypothetical protein